MRHRAILDRNKLPIIDLMENIRRKVMTRFQVKRQYIKKQPGTLCSKVQAKLKRKRANNCEPLSARQTIYEVHCTGRHC